MGRGRAAPCAAPPSRCRAAPFAGAEVRVRHSRTHGLARVNGSRPAVDAGRRRRLPPRRVRSRRSAGVPVSHSRFGASELRYPQSTPGAVPGCRPAGFGRAEVRVCQSRTHGLARVNGSRPAVRGRGVCRTACCRLAALPRSRVGSARLGRPCAPQMDLRRWGLYQPGVCVSRETRRSLCGALDPEDPGSPWHPSAAQTKRSAAVRRPSSGDPVSLEVAERRVRGCLGIHRGPRSMVT